MGSSSILCFCSNSPSPSLYLADFQLLARNQKICRPNFPVSCNILRRSLGFQLPPPSVTQSTVRQSATQELVEITSTSDLVVIGCICGVHGLQGEVRVKMATDFPDLRFSKPGTRWLKQQISGTEILKEIELVEGRGHPGQNWIVRFNSIDTVEQAQKLVGSTIWVTDQDRPLLEEGDFYTRDLIGMKVLLKESGETVGTVANVFNSGASDLLHVKLKSKTGAGDSGPLVWVPFVEAIVPTVNLENREILITPPKGLLELNIRIHEKSKKERRELEWKERKKFQRRLIAAKKKLCEMEQQHVFHGFRCGEKNQRNFLAKQIVSLNSELFQQALQNIKIPSPSQNLPHVFSCVPTSNTLMQSNDPHAADIYIKLQGEGRNLIGNGKVAVVLVLQESRETSDTSLVNSEGTANASMLLRRLFDDQIKNKSSLPLVLVCPAHSVSYMQELFSNHDFFAFDPEKVWFLEEEMLPVVGSSVEGDNKHKILMKSPWELLQRPIGSGGIISLLSSQDSLLDELSELGIEYINIRRISEKWENDHALTGLVDSRKATIGIRLFKDLSPRDDFSLIFSMSFMRKLVKQVNKLQFEAVLSCNSHVEKVDQDWVDVIPVEANSYEFRSSIYSCLESTAISKACVLDCTEMPEKWFYMDNSEFLCNN